MSVAPASTGFAPPPVVLLPDERNRRACARECALMGGVNRAALLYAVCAEFNLPVAMMTGARRKPALVEARMAFVWLARTRLASGLARIGDTLGGRHHTTILDAWRAAERRRAQNPAFAARVARVETLVWPSGEG